ncbi:virulence RhuM family protein [Thiomicrorhabdus sp. 6S2-11]|uniref:Virulence RhuM family protein n=1 Tax=Thiomicrorhabdus marina TaxID=2818442 RepID=A0ABS3Q305_9GAMM|nr:virulence RhuM family protein [Thiomicrorhabdus marina]MBO1926538.1 virulence RhuM family protein [Thiomicrorhabdus marina]
MTNDNAPMAPHSEFLLYQTEDGQSRVECRFEAETIWLTQALMAELYQKDVRTINEHLKGIYADSELAEGATIRKFRIVRQEGSRQVSRLIEHYSLEAILAVGYRVRSSRGTQFRRWATERLSEYLRKGFVMDDERLKNPPVEGSLIPDYFDELLERIRDIRASERRMYLRVKEIFSMAADYQPSSRETTQFFRIMQNKLHFAVSGQTAAEIIHSRADAELPNMGLTSTKGKSVTKADVTVAKNYLSETEIKELNRIVTMWLDFAEDQALRRKQVFMQDWQLKLDQFLEFNNRDVLQNSGQMTKKIADQKAIQQYARFREKQRTLAEKQGEEEINTLLSIKND